MPRSTAFKKSRRIKTGGFSAAVLDMDGVVVDSEAAWRKTEGPFFREIIPNWTERDHEAIVGMSVEDVYLHFARKYDLQETRGDFLRRCEKIAVEIYDHQVVLSEGLASFLSRMNREKIPVGLASSSPRRWIERVLSRFNLARYFSSILSAEDVGGRAKPAPDLYLKSAENLGAAPKDCLAVEDSGMGARAAKAAGFFCLGFRNGSNSEQDLSLCDGEFSSFAELSRDFSTLMGPRRACLK